ncbi:glycosyltransferase family 39 protein [candidate division CSSED10-310 bacterium]|uniref:Glycosyltransferase family 39 protein n=1 Tax=candidate division CSSED10-310 bacterium TaxID=2855610 RepID=A0ABV6YYX4_UNCC1
MSPTDMLQRAPAFFWYCLIVLCIALPFGLGKYVEFNSPGAFDSGAYLHSARQVLDGARPGVDERVSARMGTLLVNMLGISLCGFNECGPEIVQTVLQSIALMFMFLTLHRLYGLWPAGVSVFVAATYLSAPLLAETGNVKEQYMISCMVIGICCCVFRHLGGPWWWGILTGFFLAWGPLFKQTGMSAIVAVGFFVMLKPLLKMWSWKKTFQDILLLFTGAFISLGPVYVWLYSIRAPFEYWPYAKIWWILFPGSGTRVSSYISSGWAMVTLDEVMRNVLGYYLFLFLPIALALSSIFLNSLIAISSRKKPAQASYFSGHKGLTVLFSGWWMLDMAFVWISPRSYGQYYLPLIASAAMLAGSGTAVLSEKLRPFPKPLKISLLSVLSLLVLVMSLPVYVGITHSPYTKNPYRDPRTGAMERRYGLILKFREISTQKKSGYLSPWEKIGLYIREHSEPADRIFVWGWYPGIYVQSQRLSATRYAFTSEMHVTDPERFSVMIQGIVSDFEKRRPKFIVDSRKQHFPWNRPPLELWPNLPPGCRSLKEEELQSAHDPALLTQYELTWSAYLRKQFGNDEAERFLVMKPLREYIRKRYKKILQIGPHVLIEMDGAGGRDRKSND